MYYYQDAIINTLNGLTRDKVKGAVAQAICILLVFMFINMHMAPDLRKINPLTGVQYFPVIGVQAALVYGGLAVITLLALERPVGRVRRSRLFAAAGLALVITMLLAAAAHPIGREFLYFAVIVPFLLPVMSVVFGSRRRYRWLFDKCAVAACVGAVFTCFRSLYVVPPVVDVRYAGITQNPNRLAALCLAGVLAGFYLFYVSERLNVLSLLSIALSSVVLILTESRTATISYILVVAAFCCLNRRREEAEERPWAEVVLRVVVVLLLIGALIGGIVVFRMPEVVTAPLAEQTMATGVEPAMELEGQDVLDHFSSGRMHIYEEIIRKASAQGNDMVATGNLVVVEGIGSYVGAHNTVLEYVYRCGVPCGLAMLMIELLMLVYVLRILFSGRRCRPEEMFAVLVFIAFLVESMLEIQVVPSDRQLPYLALVASLMLMESLRPAKE